MRSLIWIFLSLLPGIALCKSKEDNSPLSKKHINHAYDLMEADNDSSLYYFNLGIDQSIAENNEDNLYRAILGKIDLFEKSGQSDSSKYHHEWLIDHASNNKLSSRTKARVFFRIGHYLNIKHDFFKALRMLDSASIFALENKDTLYYADIINKKGAVNETMGRRSVALELYLEALKIYEDFDDRMMIGSAINNIAISYKKANDLENAMLYYNKSIELAQAEGDQQSEAVTRVNRGLLYKDRGQIKEALTDLHFSLHSFKSENYHFGVAACQHNLGEIHLADNNTDSSLYYLNQSQKIAEDFEIVALLIKNNLALAKLYRKKGDFHSSNYYAYKAYEPAYERNAHEDLLEINLILSNNYQDLGEYKNALQFFKEYKNAEDTIINKDSQFALNILRTEYDLKYKDNEIESLKTKNEYQTTLASQHKKLNTLLAGGFLVIAAFLAVLYFLYHRQRNLSKKLTGQNSLLLEQKEEIEAAKEQIIQQNDSLVKLNKEKDNLIAIVAHDLRSPLNQIRGVLGLIKMEKTNDASNQLIEIANKSSEVLNERINRILDIEAINAGKVNLKTKQLEVNKVLGMLKQSVLNAAVQKKMNLIIDSSHELACVADENYLLQVLENLCTNAIKYAPEHSEINISATSEDSNVLFAVKDQGPGITDEEKASLFLPYSKTSNKPTGNETSTGLGLAIVKKYVEAMSGEVWVVSEANKGSVFFVKLPKAA